VLDMDRGVTTTFFGLALAGVGMKLLDAPTRVASGVPMMAAGIFLAFKGIVGGD